MSVETFFMYIVDGQALQGWKTFDTRWLLVLSLVIHNSVYMIVLTPQSMLGTLTGNVGGGTSGDRLTKWETLVFIKFKV